MLCCAASGSLRHVSSFPQSVRARRFCDSHSCHPGSQVWGSTLFCAEFSKTNISSNSKRSWISPNYRGSGRFYSSCRDHFFSPLLTERAVHAYAASFESYRRLTLKSCQAHRKREAGIDIAIEIFKKEDRYRDRCRTTNRLRGKYEADRDLEIDNRCLR